MSRSASESARIGLMNRGEPTMPSVKLPPFASISTRMKLFTFERRTRELRMNAMVKKKKSVFSNGERDRTTRSISLERGRYDRIADTKLNFLITNKMRSENLLRSMPATVARFVRPPSYGCYRIIRLRNAVAAKSTARMMLALNSVFSNPRLV